MLGRNRFGATRFGVGPTAAASTGGISFIGSMTLGTSSTTATTIPFSNLKNSAGATPTILQNDIVVVSLVASDPAAYTLAQLNPAGYTAAHAAVIVSYDATISNYGSMGVFYKVMGSTPDTSTVINGTTSGATDLVATVEVYRGVSTATPIDVTTTTNTGSGVAANPTPPAITPSTAGAYILGCGGIATVSATTDFTGAPGYSSATNTFAHLPSGGAVGGIALYSSWSSGAYTPSAWTSSNKSELSWCAASIALRPAPLTLNSLTGALYVLEHPVNGTVVGTPKGFTSGSTISLSDNAGGRFAINSSTGQITVLDGTLLDYATNTTHSITVVETFTGYTNTPLSTILTVNVFQPRLHRVCTWF